MPTTKLSAKKASSKKASSKKAATKKAATTKKASSKKASKKAAPTTASSTKAAMTGKASAARAAEGDAPVFAYIASLPEPQRAIAERVDAIAAAALPTLQRAVKWGMAYYGVDGGWCFSSGAFAGHHKIMFIHGDALEPVPPVTPVGMGKRTRGVEPTDVGDVDTTLLTSWMKQAAQMPFFSAADRKKAGG